ncbi:UNVERIFIED_CONTAM: hypothetical protein FKN15_051127 [Acipenser sinensis]
MTLLNENRDVFSNFPGGTNLIKHKIVTPPGIVVRKTPYRIPQTKRELMTEEIQKMLKMHVIEESDSNWLSPVVMVPKPDGTIRFCIDFRAVNEVSKFDAYPMSRIDEMIEKLGRAKFITMLDLTKGYWQVPLEENSKEKTAFSTPEGLFQFTVLPFGLHGAPATFQHLMNKVLRPHQQ